MQKGRVQLVRQIFLGSQLIRHWSNSWIFFTMALYHNTSWITHIPQKMGWLTALWWQNPFWNSSLLWNCGHTHTKGSFYQLPGSLSSVGRARQPMLVSQQLCSLQFVLLPLSSGLCAERFQVAGASGEGWLGAGDVGSVGSQHLESPLISGWAVPAVCQSYRCGC